MLQLRKSSIDAGVRDKRKAVGEERDMTSP